jgi:4-deoxy-L-threo-5-hexosulose-uronate ketol-isomerase
MKTNYQLRYAAHPEDARSYDTARLRRDFLINSLFLSDQVSMVYSLYDRLIVGGAMPVSEELPLEAIDPLKAPFFTTRRELGIFNVGGPGIVYVGDEPFPLGYKEALYIGRGDRPVRFAPAAPASASAPAAPAAPTVCGGFPAASASPAASVSPAPSSPLFYFNSAPAHTAFPTRKVTKADALQAHLGALETSNERTINKMLVREVLPTCQLQMGMTELAPGSVWNTMPAHTHERRMEAYFYFDLPDDQAVCHFMGRPDETRHLWLHNHDAVLSPEWSIHSAAATHSYTFIWGMAGENLDYGDQDFSQIVDLR